MAEKAVRRHNQGSLSLTFVGQSESALDQILPANQGDLKPETAYPDSHSLRVKTHDFLRNLEAAAVYFDICQNTRSSFHSITKKRVSPPSMTL